MSEIWVDNDASGCAYDDSSDFCDDEVSVDATDSIADAASDDDATYYTLK